MKMTITDVTSDLMESIYLDITVEHNLYRYCNTHCIDFQDSFLEEFISFALASYLSI